MSTDARPSALVHATEELLEEYTFGRVREPQLGWLEEHLLICQQCQSELEGIEEYKLFMKAGLASFESERLAAAGLSGLPAHLQTRPGSAARPRSPVRELLALHFVGPRILLVAAVLLVLAGTAVIWRMQSFPVAMAPIATINLVAFRGGDGDVAHAPSGRPLELVFNRRDLPVEASYRAEVVNASGPQMWIGNVLIEDQSLSIRLDRPLREGVYWVRLYTSTGQLLREFGLRAG